ncbi:MAG: metallophosphoesterase [Planctomycetota bacterium]|nr:metallophosphoesterase [Planctomycetota bacterium]
MILFVLLTVAAVGHVGLWIWLYNRINATGLKRVTIKRIEKLLVLACGIIPLAILATEFRTMGLLILENKVTLQPYSITFAYLIVVVLFVILFTPFWILDRPQFVIAKDRFELLDCDDLKQLQRIRTNADLYVLGSRFRKMAKLPGNQIVSMQRNRKRLYLQGLPEDLRGLRIAHLSDIHLTGQLSNSFYRLAIDWLSKQSPDLIVIAGDIVDYQSALKQLKPVFEGFQAPLGMAFILGNHDKRLADPLDVCRELCALGWTDLGQSAMSIEKGGTTIELIGNELPWFRRNRDETILGENQSDKNRWRLGVAHSPDQFGWGVANRCNLLLCGHTHGGQIRIPVVGPIISPSWYGTRYASGVFAKKSTLMHVSRGLSGVHPFRWGCLPEVSILELAAAKRMP